MHDHELSRRERQIMETLYALGSAGAREIVQHIGERDVLDSVRVTLIGLEKKGIVKHRSEGRRHIYVPAVPRTKASAAALTNVTNTFFGGSAKEALVALLDLSRDELDEKDLDELEQWVRAKSRESK
jgi:BlaI family penicillinase repressor